MDVSGALPWLFEWVAASEARAWIYIVVCVVAVLLGAAASLVELGAEYAVAALVGLLVAAHSGFFMGFCAFGLVFVGLYIYWGRGARVPRHAIAEKPAG